MVYYVEVFFFYKKIFFGFEVYVYLIISFLLKYVLEN